MKDESLTKNQLKMIASEIRKMQKNEQNLKEALKLEKELLKYKDAYKKEKKDNREELVRGIADEILVDDYEQDDNIELDIYSAASMAYHHDYEFYTFIKLQVESFIDGLKSV